METESAEIRLIPRAEVFAEAARRGLEPGDDRYDRFRAAGLITDLAWIKGTNQRGFTIDPGEPLSRPSHAMQKAWNEATEHVGLGILVVLVWRDRCAA